MEAVKRTDDLLKYVSQKNKEIMDGSLYAQSPINKSYARSSIASRILETSSWRTRYPFETMTS